MRRIWRDRQVLAGRLEAYITQLSDMEAAAFDEERTNAPAHWMRLVQNRPEAREVDFMYTTLSETDIWDTVHGKAVARDAEWCKGIGFSAETYAVQSHQERHADKTMYMAQWDDNETHLVHEVRWLTYVIEKLERLIQGLDSSTLSSVWLSKQVRTCGSGVPKRRRLTRSTRLQSPPVYWNLKGFYLTEEDAQEALAAEFEDLSEQMAADEGDAFERALLANMIMNGSGGGA